MLLLFFLDKDYILLPLLPSSVPQIRLRVAALETQYKYIYKFVCVCVCVCVHKTADITSNMVNNTQLEPWNFRNTSFAWIILVNFDRTEIKETSL